MNQVKYIEITLNIVERFATAEDVALGFAQEVGEVLVLDAETGALIG